MRMAYADPPYPGQSKRHYAEHPDYAGEVDHAELIARLGREYPDGWALSTSSTALREVWSLCPDEARLGIWVKPFAAFKNQRITKAWEPVIYTVRHGAAERARPFLRDWISAMPPVFTGSQTSNVHGEKPREFCYWLFDLLGMSYDDELHDLFPGSGAVTHWLQAWRNELRLAV